MILVLLDFYLSTTLAPFHESTITIDNLIDLCICIPSKSEQTPNSTDDIDTSGAMCLRRSTPRRLASV